MLTDTLRAVLRNAEIGRITVFCSPREVRRFDLPASERLVETLQPFAERSAFGRICWFACGLRTAIHALKPDVLLCMSGMGDCQSSVPSVMFVQQSLPFSTEALERCNAADTFRIRTIGILTKRSCRKAALIVAQTKTMAAWISKACRLADERILVVKPWGETFRIGGEESGSVEAMSRVPAHLRILYVGSLRPYKNLGCLVAAFEEIRRREPRATLFLTCPPGHPLCKIAGVVGLGYLGGTTLRLAYQKATLFVTPSLVESGNLTLIEALTMGKPIVAADRPYAHDLCGQAAIYFDPNRPTQLTNILLSLIHDEAKRNELGQLARETACVGHRESPYDTMVGRICSLAGRDPAFGK